ncbi:reactive oxygen species modulator 1-like [Mirounga leonina]|uniref:reactive oxygen species modulator 1-like n=1 Tax=Mirounga leonina TaxID=9715 RepID=UPI00156C4754|nr:reactive oxygen species modulator 1-like [Mirounga leonina]
MFIITLMSSKFMYQTNLLLFTTRNRIVSIFKSNQIRGEMGAPWRRDLNAERMPVAVGPHRQSQPSYFNHVKMGFMMGYAVGMAAGMFLGTFSCLRIGMWGWELMDGIRKTMMQSGGIFNIFVAMRMGIQH